MAILIMADTMKTITKLIFKIVILVIIRIKNQIINFNKLNNKNPNG